MKTPGRHAFTRIVPLHTAGLCRVWITNPPVARLLGNALYGFALLLLEQSYAVAPPAGRRAALAMAAVAVMRPLATIGEALTRLPAAKGGYVRSGMTFAVPRNLRDMPSGHLVPLCRTRRRRSASAWRGAPEVVAAAERL